MEKNLDHGAKREKDTIVVEINKLTLSSTETSNRSRDLREPSRQTNSPHDDDNSLTNSKDFDPDTAIELKYSNTNESIDNSLMETHPSKLTKINTDNEKYQAFPRNHATNL